MAKDVQAFDWLEPSHVMIVKLGFLKRGFEIGIDFHNDTSSQLQQIH